MSNRSYTSKIEDRIAEFPADMVFVINDFGDIAENDLIRQVLKQQVDVGKIDRIMRGVFHKPKFNTTLNEKIPPSIDGIAHAIARARKLTIAPTGEAALNALGLSTQVPMTWIYINDGPYTSFEIGGSEIRFRRSTSRDITQLSPTTLLVIQALKALGKDTITESMIEKISKRLNDEEKRVLLDESTRATIWIRSTIRKICAEGNSGDEKYRKDER